MDSRAAISRGGEDCHLDNLRFSIRYGLGNSVLVLKTFLTIISRHSVYITQRHYSLHYCFFTY